MKVFYIFLAYLYKDPTWPGLHNWKQKWDNLISKITFQGHLPYCQHIHIATIFKNSLSETTPIWTCRRDRKPTNRMAKVAEIPTIHHRLYMNPSSSSNSVITPISMCWNRRYGSVSGCSAGIMPHDSMPNDRLSHLSNLLLGPDRTNRCRVVLLLFASAITTGHMAQTNLHSRR